MGRRVELYTDGACRGNPGKGGWGVFMRYGESEKELYGGEFATTNNRMELTAVIKGLAELRRPCRVRVTTDSKYVLQGASEWLERWKRKNWKTTAKKPVLNKDLWEQLDRLLAEHEVSWEWVKGHSNHSGNEKADMLANRGIDELPLN